MDSSEEAINSPDLAKSKELEATAGAVKSGGALSKQATQVHVQKLVFGSPAVTGADAKFNLSRTAAGAGVLVISSGLQTETPCRSGDYILGLFYDDSENEINQIVAHVAGCVPTTMEVNGLSAMWTITLDHGHFDHAAAATGDIIGFMTIPASALKHRDIHTLVNLETAIVRHATPAAGTAGFEMAASVAGKTILKVAAATASFTEDIIAEGDTLAFIHGDGASLGTAVTHHFGAVVGVTVVSGKHDGNTNTYLEITLESVHPPLANATAASDTIAAVVLGGRHYHASTSKMDNQINCYSFALKPEEHQPSGTCNFSRIDNAKLICSSKRIKHIYAVNYNVLRIMSGMGGLAYSN